MATSEGAHARPQRLILVPALLLVSIIAFLNPAVIHSATSETAREGQGRQGKVIVLTPPTKIENKDLQDWKVIDGHKLEQMYSIDFLQGHKELLKRLKELEPQFKTSLIGVSVPMKVVKTKDGRELYVLRGCKPHDCGETARVIVYSHTQGSAFVLVNNYAPGKVGILGLPDEIIKNILIYYHIHWAED